MRALYFLIVFFFISFSNNAQTVTTYAGTFGGLYCDGTTFGATFSNPTGLCVDAAGNVYIADTTNHKIRKMTPAGVVTTIAGSVSGFADGSSAVAKFNKPTGIAVDGSGNLYVADSGNNKIRKITQAGIVSTFAGSTSGYADGQGLAAKFNAPYGLCCDAAGNIYVADKFNYKIRKITAAGMVSTVAGSSDGYADGNGTAAKFYNPLSIAVSSNGDLYVADSENDRIRKVTPAGTVSTFAGSGVIGTADGTGTAAQFNSPVAISIDAAGNLYVVDNLSALLRKITPAGVVTSLAGGVTGFDYGIGTNSNFAHPSGVCVDASGNVFVAEQTINAIKKITPANKVTNMAGAFIDSYSDGTGTPVKFNPIRVCADPSGNVYVAEPNYNRIRKITPSGIVSTFAGSGVAGTTDGTGTAAKFNFPQDICYDPFSGNIYVADTDNHRIRKITLAGVVTTLAGSSSGFADGSTAKFWGPKGICVDAVGNIYVADTWNFKVRKITPSGFVSTISTYSGTNGTAKTSICVDANGNTYLTDPEKYIVLKITPAGIPSTFLGSYLNGGDLDGIGTAARLNWPESVTMGNDGNIYMVDGFKIKRITLGGVVTTIAGSVSGDVDGVGSAVKFKPSGLCFGNDDTIYIADIDNEKVKKMTGFALGVPANSISDFKMALYPNPSHDALTIEVNSPISNAEASITDITGKKIYGQKIMTSASTLDISGFQNGIYFLTITDGAKRTTRKFVKQ